MWTGSGQQNLSFGGSSAGTVEPAVRRRTTAVHVLQLVGDNVPLLALQYLQYHVMIHYLCIQQLVRRLVREFTISKFSY